MVEEGGKESKLLFQYSEKMDDLNSRIDRLALDILGRYSRVSLDSESNNQ